MIKNFLLNFEALYNDLSEIIVVVDDNGLILNINNTALDMLSYNRNEILYKNISQICCDKTLENVIKCGINNYNTNLCSKYKQLIPINGKSNIVIMDNVCLTILKLFTINEEVFTNIYSNNSKSIEYSYFIKDVNGKYTFVNDIFEKYFNINKEDVLHKFDHELWDKNLSYKFRREDLYVISTKKTYVTYNTQIIGDEVVYYETSKSPVFDENNKVVAILGNIRDITESVKLRNELLIQNEQLSIIYKILNNASSKIDLKSLFSSLYRDFKTLLNVDSICVFLYNFDLDELEYCTSYGVTQTFMDSYVNTDLCREFMYDVFNSKIPVPMTNILEFNDEFKAKHTKAEGIYYCACYPLVYNDVSFGVINFGCNSEEYSYSWDNKFMEAVCRNISILLQNAILYTRLEENLKFEKEANEQINLYFNTTIDFFCIIDENFCIKKVGKQMLETLGYKEHEVMHSSIIKYMHKEDLHIVCNKMEDIVEEDGVEFLVKLLCKNGEYRTVDWNVKYLKDRGVYICSGRDLTYKIELEQKKKIVEESMHLEKLKSEFLSSISHELRTPIAIIYGVIHIMETNLAHHNTSKHPFKLNDYIRTIKKNTFRLLRLFNNILDITNVDAGFANLNLKPHNIIKVIEDISLSVKEHLINQKINLIFDTEIEEKYVNVDVDKMERIMLNLISNSVKYSKKNVTTEILVSVYDDEEKVYISIKDNGIGIDSIHFSSIFDRFNQADGSMTRKTEGSGMGLYLVKTLLQMQGADISVNSVKGEGSEFIIKFPTLKDFDYEHADEDFDCDFSVKIENFDMEFSDITY